MKIKLLLSALVFSITTCVQADHWTIETKMPEPAIVDMMLEKNGKEYRLRLGAIPYVAGFSLVNVLDFDQEKWFNIVVNNQETSDKEQIRDGVIKSFITQYQGKKWEVFNRPKLVATGTEAEKYNEQSLGENYIKQSDRRPNHLDFKMQVSVIPGTEMVGVQQLKGWVLPIRKDNSYKQRCSGCSVNNGILSCKDCYDRQGGDDRGDYYKESSISLDKCRSFANNWGNLMCE